MKLFNYSVQKSQQDYSSLEGGHTHFTDEMIKTICKAFDVSPEEFTSAGPNLHFDNSPYTHSHDSGNNHNNNDILVIQELLRAKDEVLKSKEETIKAHKDLLEAKDQLLRTQEELLKTREKQFKDLA